MLFRNEIMIIESKFGTEQRIRDYQLYPPDENGLVKVIMNVNRHYQEELLNKFKQTEKNTENNFSSAKAYNFEHPKFPGTTSFNIVIIIPKEKVLALVQTATKFETSTNNQLTENQLNELANKFPSSSKDKPSSSPRKK